MFARVLHNTLVHDYHVHKGSQSVLYNPTHEGMYVLKESPCVGRNIISAKINVII